MQEFQGKHVSSPKGGSRKGLLEEAASELGLERWGGLRQPHLLDVLPLRNGIFVLPCRCHGFCACFNQ